MPVGYALRIEGPVAPWRPHTVPDSGVKARACDGAADYSVPDRRSAMPMAFIRCWHRATCPADFLAAP